MPQFTLPSEADVRLNIPALLFTLARDDARRRLVRLRTRFSGRAPEPE